MSRDRKRIKIKPHILFLVEGETEEIFFKQLSQKYKLTASKTIKIMNNSGSNWIDKAKLKIKNDCKLTINNKTKIYIIFDSNNDNAKKIISMINYGNKLDFNGAKCKVGFSNVSFEVWLLAHFQKMNKSKKSERNLYKELSKELNIKYKKGDPKQMEKIISKNKVMNAIDNSKSIRNFSIDFQSTNIGEIIKEIIE